MSLGTQSEAETIFSYASALQECGRKENENSWNRDAIAWHEQSVKEFKEHPEWYNEPRPMTHFPYPIGPENRPPVIPAGWVLKGAGAYRRAFLSPSGVIYKVERRENSGQSNAAEHAVAQSVRSMGNVIGVIIPNSALYYIDGSAVIAMEYMEGEEQHPDWDKCYSYWGKKDCTCTARAGFCTDTIRRKIGSVFGIGDLHSNNVLWIPKQRKWAVVDLGM
jgi:hypothetical protein